MNVALDLPDLLGRAVDLRHEKINTILRVRSEQSTSLPLAHFLRYYTLNLSFANECEAMSGRVGTPLKITVTGHIQEFIQPHGERKPKLLPRGRAPITGKSKNSLRKITKYSSRFSNEVLQIRWHGPS